MENNKKFNCPYIIELLKKFETQKLDIIAIYKNNIKYNPDGIIFLKPEIFNSNHETIGLVINYFISLAQKNSIILKDAYIISNRFLIQHDIINQIYAPIMQNSLISENNFEKNYIRQRVPNEMRNYISIKGGIALEKEGYNAEFIMSLWLNASLIVKVEENFYAAKVLINNVPILLINGFYPYQYKQYSKDGNKIIIFTLQTIEDFTKLKKEFQGNLDDSGNDQSMRKYFLSLQKQNLLKDISNSKNGIHMSGSIEEGKSEATIFLNAFKGL